MTQSEVKPILIHNTSPTLNFEDRTFEEIETVDGLTEKTSEYGWSFGDYFSALSTERLGKSIVFADTISSTQDLVRKNANSLENGTVCICNTQTSGRGRRTNTWTSPRGCLMFTLCVHFPREVGAFLPLFQYLMGVAIVEAIGDSPQRLDVRIKWPNDIYTADKVKIGGILCGSQFRSDFAVLCGVGLNVDNAEPSTCLNKCLRARRPGTQMMVSNEPFRREIVLASIFNTLEPMLTLFRNEGFAPFEERYLAYWIHSDQELSLKRENDESDTKLIRVRVTGIDSRSGAMLAVDNDGNEHSLMPDLNSLDLFAGLIISN